MYQLSCLSTVLENFAQFCPRLKTKQHKPEPKQRQNKTIPNVTPPTGASRRSTWLFWVVAVEVPQEILVQDVPMRNPQLIL